MLNNSLLTADDGGCARTLSEQAISPEAKNFFAYETNRTQGKWVVTECGKDDLCVKTDYELKDGDVLTILIGFDWREGRVGNMA